MAPRRLQVARRQVRPPASKIVRRVIAWSFALAFLVPTPLFAQATTADPAIQFLQHNRTEAGVTETPSGLQYKVIAAGQGDGHPSEDDVVLVDYKGMLTNGTVFDQSRQPVAMPVSGVIPGFAEALKLMPRGATYRFWIKPELGYGDQATGPIPANSILIFDLVLLDWKSPEQIRMMQQQLDAQRAGASPAAPLPPSP